MWNFVVANWWMFLIACIIFVGAAVGVVIGVITKGGWADRDLMVRDGHRIRWAWNVFPLQLVLDRKLPTAYWHAVNRAVGTIEDAAGRKLFSFNAAIPSGFDFSKPLEDQITVTTHSDAGVQQLSHGYTTFNYDKRDGLLSSCAISLPDTIKNGNHYPVCLHELMHCLGFDHDEQRGSVMYAFVLESSQQLSDADQKRLRRLYGPK